MSKKSGRRAMPVRPRVGGSGGRQQQLQRLQADITHMQEMLGEQTVTATAGGGVVEVTVNGNQQIVSLKLAPEVVDPEDIEMLQDLIVAAVNDGLNKSRDLMSQQLSGLAGGLGVEGMI